MSHRIKADKRILSIEIIIIIIGGILPSAVTVIFINAVDKSFSTDRLYEQGLVHWTVNPGGTTLLAGGMIDSSISTSVG